ncbi:MAG: hypothetical protein LBJ75_02645 [Puniceicoccales bacterium]|jgi:hypothetical protein|nr:hypothetical protein [Puniceicoccales bacterium]
MEHRRKAERKEGMFLKYLVEGVFNDMPFFVDVLVVEALKIPVALGRDERNDAARGKGKDDFVGIVGFVGENASGI